MKRRFYEIPGEGRGLDLPLQPSSLPWIIARNGAILKRPAEVEKGQHVAHAEDSGSCGREYIQDLKLRRVTMVAPWHSEIAKYELRHKCQVETDEGGHSRQF